MSARRYRYITEPRFSHPARVFEPPKRIWTFGTYLAAVMKWCWTFGYGTIEDKWLFDLGYEPPFRLIRHEMRLSRMREE